MSHSRPAEHSHQNGENGISAGNTNGCSNGENINKNSLQMDERTKLYTDAYTHGYTHGYMMRHSEPEAARQIPIAIIGMSCRLPGGVSTPDEFWELCSRARDGWSEIPKQRFEAASFHHPNPGKSGCFNAIGGNFLQEDVGLFDAPFFSLTAQEATSMDPQQRLLLECTFEALDSAGIPKHEIVGKDVGVFIGGSFSEYESQLFADTETVPMYQSTGKSLIATCFTSRPVDMARLRICNAGQQNFTLLQSARSQRYHGYRLFLESRRSTSGLSKFAKHGIQTGNRRWVSSEYASRIFHFILQITVS